MSFTFIKSASSPSDWINDSTTEVVFIGRSNVGKSSLINALAKDNKLARTSKTPGRTQLANFFDFKDFRLIDLPGYGFAKLAKNKRTDLTNIIDTVLMHRSNVYMVVQIIDANVVTNEDVNMNKYLSQRFKNVYVVLNKADKSKLNFYNTVKSKYAKYLNCDPNKMIFTSTTKDINIKQLHLLIKSVVNEVK